MVVASDPTSSSTSEAPSTSLTHPSSSIGESPYFLLCSACKWDSKSVGIQFEKPTGLSSELSRSFSSVAIRESLYEEFPSLPFSRNSRNDSS